MAVQARTLRRKAVDVILLACVSLYRRTDVMPLTVRCEKTRGIARIGGWKINKDDIGKLHESVLFTAHSNGKGVTYNKDTGRKDHNANGRCDPVNIRPGCPGKDE